MSKNNPFTYIDLERAIIFIVLLILTYRFIQITAGALILFVLVFLIFLLLNPVIVWLKKRGFSRTWAAILTVLVILILLALILTIILPPIINQINVLIKEAPSITNQLLSQIKQVSKQITFLQNITDKLDLNKILSTPPVFRGIAKAGQSLVGVVFFAILAIFLVIFMLSNPKPVLVGFLQFFPEEKIYRVREGIILLSQDIAMWFYSSLIIGSINGITIGIGFFIVGAQFPLIFAVLYILAEFIPYIGPLAVAIVAVLFALSQNLLTTIFVLAIIIIVQTLEGSLWSPLILSQKLNLHPFSIVFGILAAEALLGLAGAVLAIPTLLAIKIFYYEFYAKTFPSNFLETEAEEIMEMQLKHVHGKRGEM